MNSFLRCLALVFFSGLLGLGLAHAGERSAQSSTLLASATYPNRSNNATDNGAIRRANPNSRQGTESISPSMRGPNLSPTPSRTPTLENGGIGNGYPTRQNAPRPSSTPQRGNN
ncbi:hypothetical protein [Pseudomonas sp. NPDC088444]|uniref:hypothetical protein n=1 Tax=Pseudomonas sp. NPDC088444 TaxID=3364456 RepID=UPI00384FBD2F